MTASQSIIANAKAICKYRQIPISHLEKAIGVATGYFAQFSHRTNSMALDKAVRIADFLGISLHELAESNIALKSRIEDLEAEIAVKQEELAELKRQLVEAGKEKEEENGSAKSNRVSGKSGFENAWGRSFTSTKKSG